MKKIFTIENDMFDMQTTIAIGVSDKKLFKWIEENTTVDLDDDLKAVISLPAHCMARTIHQMPLSIIRFSSWGGTVQNISHLAHEAFHLAEFALSERSIIYDMEKSGEVFAYFIQDVVAQVLKVLSTD